MGDANEKGPPALPGEVWRGEINSHPVAVCDHGTGAYGMIWWRREGEQYKWTRAFTAEDRDILATWARSQTIRAEKAEALVKAWQEMAESAAEQVYIERNSDAAMLKPTPRVEAAIATLRALGVEP